MATTTSCSSSSSSFSSLRSSTVEPRVRSATSQGSPGGCAKVDSVAMWFINGVATAFFASLERCSCIHIATEGDSDEANDLPLIANDGNLGRDGGSGSRRRAGKGKKRDGFLEDFMDDK